MKRNKIAALIAGATLAATAAGCQSTNTNSNLNGNTANGNQGVVTNNNGNTNTAGVTTANGNTMNGNTNMTRGNYNANITREEYDRDKDRYSREARDTGRSVGTGANDGWLWTKTRAKLLTTDDLRESTINVDVDNAVVTLTGTVASKAQSDRAKTVASSVDGVKSVNNRLTISGGSTNTNANSNTRR